MRVLLAALLMLAGCNAHRDGLPLVRLALLTPSTNNYPSYFAEWLEFYRQEGVDVRISEMAGASRALEALVGGSADVIGGVYEQTLQMAAEGKSLKAFVTLIASPNFALVISPASKRALNRIADLRGATIGVSALGSPSQFYLNYLLEGNGVAPSEVSTTGIGVSATAVAAVEHGQVDGAILFGAAIPILEKRHPGTRILADTRTKEGLRQTFRADSYPASSVMATADWLRNQPETAHRIARAVRRSLDWLRTHSAEEILDKVPPSNRLDDREAELAAIRLAKPMYSVDGQMTADQAETVRRVLSLSLEKVRAAQIDLSATYTNEFVSDQRAQ